MKFYFLGYTYQETHWQGGNDNPEDNMPGAGAIKETTVLDLRAHCEWW